MTWTDDELDLAGLDLDTRPERLGDLDLPVGGVLVIPEIEHGERRLGTVTVEHVDGWFVPCAGPVVDLTGLAGPLPESSVDAVHRALAERYRARVLPADGPWEVVVSMTGEALDAEAMTDQVLEVLDATTAAWQLDDDMDDGTLAALVVAATAGAPRTVTTV